ncbi:YozE family protein [Anoxybacillus sp. J5B_2022]|uniref:YozE family protein n=1 Tax=Anoxybacillus sp. J5B_2022 TaxID=3003246 RepID=UPI0022859BB7|nr:YozE family protein [Anoxybacillus sp. J5B_2022]MCZ0755709.1 YozE family protein [Anoxybacillus sp. J5B_2022]
MRSFYRYLLKFRDGKKDDPVVRLANGVYYDHSFPKNSADYDEISRYLEMNGDYLESMSIFDEVWERFLQEA